MKKLSSLSLLSVLPMLSLAAAPVIDTTGTVAVPAPTQQQSAQAAASSNAQVLTQQVENLIQMNLPQQISQLEQNVQDMRGIIEIQGHQIQALQKQLQQLTGKSLPSMQVKNQSISQLAPAENLSGSGVTANLNQAMSPKIDTQQQQKMVTAKMSSPSAQQQAPANNATAANTTAANSNTAALSTPSSSGNTAQDKQKKLYEAAYSQIQTKDYTAAINGMKNYLSQYPAGKYVPNAHYWLGELYMISGNNQQATTEFSTVVKDYPKSNKAADSLLKLGLLDLSVQKYKEAKAQFNAVVNQFPNSPSARIANEQLEQLNRAGY